VSKYQNLSAPFIKKFTKKLDWDNISESQKLSEPLIRKFGQNWYQDLEKVAEEFYK
jgi:hypothetical protein